MPVSALSGLEPVLSDKAANARAAAVLSLASFIVTFDITAVVVAMPQIKADLGLGVAGFAWVMDAYSLAFTLLLTSAGVLADRYGRRRALLAGNAVFAAASLVCGLAEGEAALWAARAAQGIGSAFVICGCLALLSDRFQDPVQRGKAFALVGTVTGAAMALGPSVGGLIADAAGWRWVFLINLPICLAIAAGVPRVVAESRDPASRRVDLAGVAALTVTLLSLTWLLLHGPEIGGVSAPGPLAALVPILGLAAFVLTQKLQAEPMIDLSLFRNPAFLGMCFVPVALSFGYWSLLVYLPLFLQNGLGQLLDMVSWLMLAATLPMLLLPFLGARLLARLTPRRFFPLGLVGVAGGCALLFLAAREASLLLALLGMGLCGASTAVLNAQLSSVIMSFAPKERSGTVSAVATTLRQASFAAGIAALGALLNRFGGGGTAVASEPFGPLFLSAALATLAAALLVFVLLGRAARDPSQQRATG